MGEFDLVVTSPLPRALQTAVAFGYGVDEVREDLKEYSEIFRPLPPWDAGFQALYHYFIKYPEARVFLRQFVGDILTKNPRAKKILFVSHSGIVESCLLSCLQEQSISQWGEPLSYCEGVSWHWDGTKFLNPNILRVENN
jgi:broad specificity phosphatase PhoE